VIVMMIVVVVWVRIMCIKVVERKLYYSRSPIHTQNLKATFVSVVATTRRNGTCDMLTSAKLSVGYLVVGITRELDKEPSLY